MRMNSAPVKAGDLLVASPQMDDDFFNDSVILISAVNAEAVVGFIINRPISMPVSELAFENLDDFYKTLKRRVFIGGPVDESSLHLIAMSDFGGKEIVPGIRMGGNFNCAEEMLNSDERQNRLTLGYTAWGVEQLKGEIRNRDWIVYPNASIADVFWEIDSGNMSTSKSAMAILGEFVGV